MDKTKFPPKGITENQRKNRKVSMNALDLSGKGKAKTYDIGKKSEYVYMFHIQNILSKRECKTKRQIQTEPEVVPQV